MQTPFPNVVHPTTFNIRGVLVEIVAFAPLTDAQAMKIALMYARTHRIRKGMTGKTVRVVTTFDGSSRQLL